MVDHLAMNVCGTRVAVVCPEDEHTRAVVERFEREGLGIAFHGRT